MPSIPFITSIQAESADNSAAILYDLTTDYGVGGNPARNTLALYLYLYKRDVELNDTAISVDNTNPTAVTQWSFSLAGDGWYPAIVFGFKIWAAGTFTLNQCVYHSGSYYKCNAASTTGTPGVSGDWTLITNILTEVLNLGSSNVYITQTNNFTTSTASSGPIADELADFGEKVMSGKCRDWNEAAKVLKGAALIQSALINHRRNDNQQAQEIIDYVNTQYS